MSNNDDYFIAAGILGFIVGTVVCPYPLGSGPRDAWETGWTRAWTLARENALGDKNLHAWRTLGEHLDNFRKAHRAS